MPCAGFNCSCSLQNHAIMALLRTPSVVHERLKRRWDCNPIQQLMQDEIAGAHFQGALILDPEP